MSLMTFEEMKRRYDEGEDSLELALDKWQRILNHSNTIFQLFQFQDVLKAAVVPILLCAEYSNQCHMCPIYSICKQGHSEDWTTLMRVVQAYAIAGDILPKEPLHGQIEMFVIKLKKCRENIFGKLN